MPRCRPGLQPALLLATQPYGDRRLTLLPLACAPGLYALGVAHGAGPLQRLLLRSRPRPQTAPGPAWRHAPPAWRHAPLGGAPGGTMAETLSRPCRRGAVVHHIG